VTHDELTTPAATGPLGPIPIAPPDPASAIIVKPAAGSGGQSWVGSPSAVRVGDAIVIAYRLRDEGRRGYAVEVARSADGVHFQPVVSITKEQMACESLERPALALTAAGAWRLYLSCATPGTKHWRVELIEANAPEEFDPGRRIVILPGDSQLAVKDPVIVEHGGQWHLWASVHPLDDPDATDRMRTDYATSADGLVWAWQGTALAPRPGEWDARGVRVAAVRFSDDGVTAFYDGRATAEQNCEERTGIAEGLEPGALTAVGTTCVGEAGHAGFGLRYLTVVDLGDGYERLYYELTNANGSHDLVTELRPAAMTADVAAAVDAEQATAA
jgi:hypothetical protein